MREADAGVSRCAFDDGAAGAELAAFFGIFNHVEGSAVFDTAAGVLEFGFAVDFAAGFVGKAGEADQGGVANCLQGQ